MVLGEEAAVDLLVLVSGDGDDGKRGVALLKREQAGQLFDAGRAPGGPEIEHDGAAAELREIDGTGRVGDGEQRGGPADVAGVLAAVAGDGQEKGCEQDGEGFAHGLAPEFL